MEASAHVPRFPRPQGWEMFDLLIPEKGFTLLCSCHKVSDV